MDKTAKHHFRRVVAVVFVVFIFTTARTSASECGQHFNGSEGVITSPGYPAGYQSGPDCTNEHYGGGLCVHYCVSHCTWTISTASHKTITLSFNDFNISYEDFCCPSHLEVWDGTSLIQTSDRLVSYCGTRIPDPVTSTSNSLTLKLTTTETTSGVSFNASWTTGCASQVLETSSGQITSPGFPEPPTEDGSCVWTISVDPEYKIDFTLHTIALGPVTDEGLLCEGDWVKSVVSLYDSITTDKSKLLGRYCTTKAGGKTISTTGNHLTIVYTATDTRSAYWNTDSDHGFNATYQTRNFTDSSEQQTGPFPYGQFTKDFSVSKSEQTSGCISLIDPSNGISGIVVGNGTIRGMTVHINGKITFSESPECNDNAQNYVCTYCTDIDHTDDTSDVFFKNYTTCRDQVQTKIVKKVCEDANSEIKKYTNKDFSTSVMVIATWHSVRPRWNWLYDGRATFQVAIISDISTTYALLYYKDGDMKWRRNFDWVSWTDIRIGTGTVFHGTTVRQQMPYTETSEALELDIFKGNTGRLGTWIYKLGDLSPDADCKAWYQRNLPLKDEREEGFSRLPKCPCSARNIRAYDSWVYTVQSSRNAYCFILSKSASRNLLPYSKLCCYRGPRGTLVQEAPNAGPALAFNPSYPSYFANYTREDEEAYSTCCLKSSSSDSCDDYYELRPIGQCDPSLPFRFAWLCCDPHILTLDGRDYLLNDWGEHTLITLKTADVTFTLQSRTGLAETGNGDLTNATVFTAFGAEENGVRVFAGLDPSDNTSLIVYGNGTDYSVHFNNNSSFVKDTDQFKLVRDNNSLIISFPSGLGFATSVRMKSLAVSVNVPLAFKGQTRGLLGDYNGNKEDDFILPNGTVLSNNLTERQIFEQFGKAWRVTEANTVMHYGRREGPSDYAHPEFTPIFLDEVPLSVRQAAEDVCGSSTNLACIYDYVATKSASIAMDSKQIKEEADETNELAENTVPQLQGLPSRLSVTSGVVTAFSLEGRDADSDDVLTYHAVDDGNGMVQVDSASGNVTYIPDSSQPISLSFYTVDSHNAQSPVRVVPVLICSGCSGHGTCDFSLYSSAENGDYNFQFASCVCDPAWDGPHCERDRDGCLGNPCLPEQTCTDLTPAQQGQNQIGYDCGGCPAGYILDTSSQECVDTDECANSQTNECDMNCFNTLGSYLCTCDAGYRLDNDGHTCWDINECQEQTDKCEHFCNNTAGSYTCMCEEGYTLGESGTTCTQDAATVSLCSNAGCSHGCKSSLDSSTGQRVPECICPDGFDLDPTDEKTCRDHDECQDNLCTQRCYNYNGGFACYCNRGYKLSDDKVTCERCPPLHYGINCVLTCSCSGRFKACDPVKGCICEDGWTGSLCQEDVDECSNKTICSSDQICVNTIGSYECNCQDGYRKDSTGMCQDINECVDGSSFSGCGELEICVNLPGEFYCKCLPGYRLVDDQCTDVDECASSENGCEQICDNVQGTYNCDCYYGYRLNTDRTSCTKVSDVCAEVEGLTCDHGCTLSDVDDRAACFCRTGYELGNDQQTCQDIDECSAGTSGCNHTCSNTDGGFLCSCPLGRKLDNDGKTCLECPIGTYGTDCSEMCACGRGSERCDVITGCVCKPEWQGERCTDDVNECDRANVQQECRDKNAQCVNYPGGHSCQCGDGYEEDENGLCQDIDECLSIVCDQRCENSPGSYRCLCNKGFTLDSQSGLCEDIDECVLSVLSNCTQRCLNVAGSYKCTCDQDGYVISSDGVSCVGTTSCSRTDCPTQNGGCSDEQCFCNRGYNLTATNTCELEDVDWCAEGLCDQDCQETTNGESFTCSCRLGYLLQEDGRSCFECPPGKYGEGCSNTCTCNVQTTVSCHTETGACTCRAGWQGSACGDDIDECAGASSVGCPQNSDCENTIGSYRCICHDGYLKDSTGNCTRCTGGGGCPQQCNCGENAESCDGSTGACVCKEGWEGTRCETDLNECLTGQHDCRGRHSLCVNKVGGYECGCEEGFTRVESAGCLGLRHVKATFTITGISVTSDDISDVNSPSFSLWARSVSQELDRLLRPKVKGFRSVDILALRVGSLIVDTDVVLDETSHPDATQTLSVALLDLVGDSLTVNNQTGTVQVAINDAPGLSTWTACDVYKAIRPCSDEEECRMTDQLPECRTVEPAKSSEDYTLIIILGISIPLVIIVLGVIIVIVLKKSKKARKRGSYILRHPRKPEGSDIRTTSQAANSGSETTDSPYATTHELSEHPYQSLKTSQENETEKRPQSTASYLSVGHGWTDADFLSQESNQDTTDPKSRTGQPPFSQ